MYKILLNEEDMIKENHFPIIAHINEAYNDNLVEFIDSLRQGVGVGYNYTCSSFWNELDDYDKQGIERYEGLLIETEDDEKMIFSLSDVLYYLEVTYKKISASDSVLASNVSNVIKVFKSTYNLS